MATTKVSVTVDSDILDRIKQVLPGKFNLSGIVNNALRDHLHRHEMLALLDEMDRDDPPLKPTKLPERNFGRRYNHPGFRGCQRDRRRKLNDPRHGPQSARSGREIDCANGRCRQIDNDGSAAGCRLEPTTESTLIIDSDLSIARVAGALRFQVGARARTIDAIVVSTADSIRAAILTGDRQDLRSLAAVRNLSWIVGI